MRCTRMSSPPGRRPARLQLRHEPLDGRRGTATGSRLPDPVPAPAGYRACSTFCSARVMGHLLCRNLLRVSHHAGQTYRASVAAGGCAGCVKGFPFHRLASAFGRSGCPAATLAACRSASASVTEGKLMNTIAAWISAFSCGSWAESANSLRRGIRERSSHCVASVNAALRISRLGSMRPSRMRFADSWLTADGVAQPWSAASGLTCFPVVADSRGVAATAGGFFAGAAESRFPACAGSAPDTAGPLRRDRPPQTHRTRIPLDNSTTARNVFARIIQKSFPGRACRQSPEPGAHLTRWTWNNCPCRRWFPSRPHHSRQPFRNQFR